MKTSPDTTADAEAQRGGSALLSGLRALNLGIAFLLELCLLAALVYWGFTTGDGLPAKLALGLGAPLVAAVVWGAFLAPRATSSLIWPWRLLLEAAVFVAGALALYAAGQAALAVVFLAAVALNQGALYLLKK